MGYNYLADISFVGTRYHGSQIQSNALTVQEVFQDAMAQVLPALPDIKCCSRTDSGVHARQFCISFELENEQDCGKFARALNGCLPPDIRVKSVTPVPDGFHARYSSTGKKYEYLVWNAPVMDPFLDGRAYHFPHHLDEEALNGTASVFLGTHDFSSFCSVKSPVEDKVRTVSEATVRREGDLVVFSFAADGFLYNMARVMSGALIQTARGKLDRDGINAYLSGRPRDSLLITVPACGLYLTEVRY